MDINKFIRPNILNLKPYSSARDEFSGEAMVFLDANENALNPDYNRYPDPQQIAVKKRLAEIKDLSVNQTFLGNGSDEAIDLIIRIFCEPGVDNVLITDPTYGMYQVSADINNIKVLKVPLNKDFDIDAKSILTEADDKTKVIFLCSPNNPSGNDLSSTEIELIIKQFEGVVVIDEAYIDFSKAKSWVSQIAEFPNLIVLQTFSKAWGLAGIRLGMAFSNDKVITIMNKVKPPYNINELTQQQAILALDNIPTFNKNRDLIMQERESLKGNLIALEMVEKVYPSEANFLLVKFRDSKAVFNNLLEKGIIVRDRSKALNCNNCLRITVGSSKENQDLMTALNSFKA